MLLTKKSESSKLNNETTNRRGRTMPKSYYIFEREAMGEMLAPSKKELGKAGLTFDAKTTALHDIQLRDRKNKSRESELVANAKAKKVSDDQIQKALKGVIKIKDAYAMHDEKKVKAMFGDQVSKLYRSYGDFSVSTNAYKMSQAAKKLGVYFTNVQGYIGIRTL